MSVDVNQLLPQQQQQQPHNNASATITSEEQRQQPAIIKEERDHQGIVPHTTAAAGGGVSSGGGSGGGGGGGGGRKRKRNSGSNRSSQSSNFNNNKRQKNKQQNIIICGGGGGGGGKLPIPSGGGSGAVAAQAAATVPVIGNGNNSLPVAPQANSNNNNNCSKSNAENYGGGGGGGGRNNNKNFYHKIHFRHLNGGRSRRLQLFPALSKFFLPDKRPRKEIIIPPTKFLLGGNISDPLNLNSLQDDDVEASPKSSPMMTPPKVEVIIPPNIRDPLHLLDPVDSIEYEKQLTSPMKKMMGIGGGGGGGGGKRSHNKKKNRSGGGRNSFQKDRMSFSEGVGGGDQNTSAADGGDLMGGADACGRVKEENLQDNGGCGGVGDILGQAVREALKLELSVDVDLPERKRRVSESSTQASSSCGGKPKMRRMDSIVSPVIPQPGGHKRHMPMGPQGAPHRNRSRTHSVQSTDNEDLKGIVPPTEDDSLKVEGVKEESELNRSSDSIKSSAAGSSSSTGEVGDVQVKTEGAEGTPQKEQGGAVKVEKKTPDAKGKNKKNKSNVFQFGNYDRYYGYRNLNEMMDVRLRVFQQNEFLFKDKDVLDIGCNVGHLTIAVAKNFAPRSVLGLDIDPKLIVRAKQNVSLFVRVPPPSATQVSGAGAGGGEEAVAGPSTGKSTNRKRKRGKNSVDTKNKQFAEFFPQSFPLCYGLIPDVRPNATTTSSSALTSAAASAGASSMTPTSATPGREGGGLLVATGPKTTEDQQDTQQQQQRKKETLIPDKPLFPKNIRFIANNYVLKSDHQLASDERHKYDLILCLSVTKWVHLNYGDTGLKMMFRRIFNQLRPGGKFILEAQNWASYKKKKKLTDRIFRNFQQIEFYPSHFHEYLLSPEVGFSHSYPLGVPRHLSKGFRRPIQLYVKGDYTPSQVMWSDAHHPPQTPYTPYRGIYAEMMCPPPRGYNANSSVWGGGDNTPFRPMASTSQYYNPLETDSYLPSYETEVTNRRYCFQSPLYSAEWSPPPLSSSNSETRTPPKPSTWSVSTTPMTPTNAMQGGGSVTNTPHHVYPPDELLDLENPDSEDQPSTQTNGSGVSPCTPRTEEDSPEH